MKDYDEENIFNKILKKIVKCVKIFEDLNNLSFEDRLKIMTGRADRGCSLNTYCSAASDLKMQVDFLKW